MNKLFVPGLQRVGLVGLVTLTNYPITTARAKQINDILATMKPNQLPKSKYQQLLSELALESRGEIKTKVFKNQVVLSGRSIFARLLVGDVTYSGEINYGALGDTATAVTDGDTGLANELVRKQVALSARTNDSITFDFFYSKADGADTYEEFGCFIDGTETLDSGQLYNRVLTGGWVKSATEAMTVSIQFDINSA